MDESPFLPQVGLMLSESVRRVRALRMEHGYVPTPGARILNDWELVKSPAGGVIESLGLLIYDVSGTQLAAAEDHVESLGELLVRRRSVVTPFVVARAAIEASARAIQILDPNLTTEKRASLVVAERIHELHQLRKLMKSHDVDEDSDDVAKDLANLDRTLQKLRDFASTYGIKSASRPKFEAVITNALSSTGEAHSLVTVAATAYSAVAHAVPDIVLTYTVDRSREEWEPFEVGARELRFSLVLDMVVTVLVAYTRAVKLQIEAYGWTPDSWAKWLDHVRGRLLEALEESQQAEKSDQVGASARVDWRTLFEDPDVEISIPINSTMREILEAQRRDFIKKFGRPPADDEPIFFDPAASEPEPTKMSEDEYVSQLIWMMELIGELTPARDYAVRKCGFVASSYSWPHLPPDRRSEWTSAIKEYYSSVGQPAPPIEEELVQLPDD